jgi:hypothetical protein
MGIITIHRLPSAPPMQWLWEGSWTQGVAGDSFLVFTVLSPIRDLIRRLLFLASWLFVSVALLFNTTDAQSCIASTVRQSQVVGGVVSANVSAPIFLNQTTSNQVGLGSKILSRANGVASGSLFQAPIPCSDPLHCSTFYLLRPLSYSQYINLMNNFTEYGLFKMYRVPIMHAVVEPYNVSATDESQQMCRVYGRPAYNLTLCVGETYDANLNESFGFICKFCSIQLLR